MRLGPFEVLSSLGCGGMGEVYRARDTRLGRDVALKTLPASLGGQPTRLARLRREARILASLSHPHIATLFGLEESDGQPTLVMELVEGPTLAERVRLQPPSVPEALDLARQIAAGLEAAHEKGILHRDLKPANIVIDSKGQVKLLDFGLATTRDDDVADSHLSTQSGIVSGPGAIVGTAPYMSPEQARGEEVDKRSDVWSFGCVLYELLAGQRAFPGASWAEVTAAILDHEPDWTALPETTPPGVRRLLERSLQKDRAKRLRDIGDARLELEEPGTSRWARSYGRSGAWLAVVIIAAAMATFLARQSHGVWQPQEIRSLAVMPLQDLTSSRPAVDLADGMTDALITELAKIGAIRVISRQSIMQYRNTSKPVAQIAAELNVDGIVEGTVMREGSTVRITAQLIQARPERHLWAERYERDPASLLVLQSEIARAIATAIRATVTPTEEALLAKARRVNPQAYEAYTRGVFLMENTTRDGITQGIEYFRRAIDLDPEYAPAFAGLADAYNRLAIHGYQPPHSAYPLAKTAVVRALELDETLAEAHVLAGVIAFRYDWDWAKADRELTHALTLSPGSSRAHLGYGTYLLATGRVDEAVRLAQRCVELDPLTVQRHVDLAWKLAVARRLDEAITCARRAMELDLSDAYGRLGAEYAAKGLQTESLAMCDEAFRRHAHSFAAIECDGIYVRAGRRQDAVDHLNQLLSQRDLWHYRVARLYDVLGEREQAMQWLLRAYDARAAEMCFLKIDALSPALRADPRYQDLVRRMNYPL